MDLTDALRTTGAMREFTDEPVGDEALARILDTARFAPSGGNKQAWRVVIVRDPARRRALRDLYLPGWHSYLTMTRAGLRPWAPITDESAERTAREEAEATFADRGDTGDFAEHLDELPELLVLLADLRLLAATDRDLDRYTLVGGASIYPFAWNLLLAARAEGVGGVITTMVVPREAEVKEIVGALPELAVAALIALGRPERFPRRLTRQPVDTFASYDTVDGPPVTPPATDQGEQ